MTSVKNTTPLWQGEVASSFDPAAEVVVAEGDCLSTLRDLPNGFAKLCGIEIVPVKALAPEMSSGVSYFEQFVRDLESRGVADIDIPVLVMGIDS